VGEEVSGGEDEVWDWVVPSLNGWDGTRGWYESMQISKILRVVEMGIHLKIENGLT
jgi:hypothetical protein